MLIDMEAVARLKINAIAEINAIVEINATVEIVEENNMWLVYGSINTSNGNE